jgi:hypothetical protein
LGIKSPNHLRDIAPRHRVVARVFALWGENDVENVGFFHARSGSLETAPVLVLE